MPEQNGGSSNGIPALPGGISASSIFGGMFARGRAVADDPAWLRALLDTEAALARAVERAGLVPAGAGPAVTAAAAPSGSPRSPFSARRSPRCRAVHGFLRLSR